MSAAVEVGGQLGFGVPVLLSQRRNRCKQKDASTCFAQKCDGEGGMHDAATEKRLFLQTPSPLLGGSLTG
jgi:hypothetical protein